MPAPGAPVHAFGLDFPHRIGLAAGFDKNAEAIDAWAALGFAFVEIGAVTPRPQAGNPRPRLFRLTRDRALINRMGFNNKGLDYVARRLQRRRSRILVGANIGKNTDTPNNRAHEDYFAVFEGLHDLVDYFTVNVSCPNIGDLRELQDEDHLVQLLEGLQAINRRKAHPKPILVKISPDLTDAELDATISACRQAGAAGIVAVNTSTTRAGLATPATRIKRIGPGGLSGHPIKRRATEVIRYIHEKTGGSLPVIGVGGIFNPADAHEKVTAGATLLQVFTGFVYEGPGLIKKLARV